MLKRQGTPSAKERVPSKNAYHPKPSKDLKNVQSKPSLSRNSSSSRLNISPLPTEPIRFNPESADKGKLIGSKFSEEMRKVVVEWMLEVSHFSKMRKETAFMAVKVFDNGLESMRDISPINAQLLAVTCLFISAKY